MQRKIWRQLLRTAAWTKRWTSSSALLEAGPCVDLSKVEEGPEVEEDGVNNRDIDDAASPIELDDSSPQLKLAERSDDDDDDNS